ncbi:serine/threonine protein kinase [Stieleria sp. JC731]|uniref:serine/threonine-protein kinase n=1 Tax=Pirellulaceae TaxID=2691357 RepID=UPI001E4A8081|nr:serine/threonine-protein kinase [Stieleria sp. JC731]MCC9600126.1 serine/threonine protein kinase [Stieleria sp. JC731]
MIHPSSSSHQHPSDVQLLACLDQESEAAIDKSVVEHLDHCADCQRRIESISNVDDSNVRIVSALQAESQAAMSSKTANEETSYSQSPQDFAVHFLQPSSSDDAIGRIGDFDVVSVIGVGGMGVVLKGIDSELNRPVAIKVMSPHLAALGVARQRFLREAQATAAIVHPNVMPVLSVSESTAQLPFLVMPYVVCHSLQQRIDAEGALKTIDVLRIAAQVAAALAAAHKQGLVHRDVKPANILLERGVDRSMLTDFGLARAADDVSVTRSGFIAGTPQFMSPEQARGEGIDQRSDLFSLGAVIYTMSVGRPPFQSETSYGVLRKIVESHPKSLREQNPDVPDWMESLVLRLLAKDAASRPQSATEVQELIEACLAHIQQPTIARIPESLLMSRQTVNRSLKKLITFIFGFALVGCFMSFGSVLMYLNLAQDDSNESTVVPMQSVELEFVDPVDESIDNLQDQIDELRQEINQNDWEESLELNQQT